VDNGGFREESASVLKSSMRKTRGFLTAGRIKVLLDVVALFAIGLLFAGIATMGVRWPFANMAEGELRCESGGAVVVKIAGKDYAVNGMASTRYPPIQQIWNDANYPGTRIDRIITRGLTLCDW
jgi:hypothetical protein